MTPSPQKPALDIPNLPEGIEAYAMQVAGDDDFELVGGQILKGKRAGSAAGLLVRPAAGYSFETRKVANIRDFTVSDAGDGTYMVVKQESPVQITATLKVTVSNSFDQSIVDNALGALKGLPGFVSIVTVRE